MKYIHPCYKGMTKNIKISCIQNKKQLKREGSVCLKAKFKGQGHQPQPDLKGLIYTCVLC